MRFTKVKTVIMAIPAIAAAAALSACSAQAHASAVSPAAGGDTTPATVSTASSTVSTVPTPTSTTTVPPTTTRTTTTTTKPTTTKPKPTTTKPAVATSNPCGIESGACVVLSARKVWIVRNGQVIYGPVSTMPGSSRYPTPTGTFHVLSKEVKHLSKEFDNAPMPYSVFFYPGDAFHEGSLSQYSHGCLHLSWTAAETVFNDLHVGDEVKILK
ncbi:MAG TPA: L,D-transpeptidase [Pseudonocardiaceae bacterium]